MCTFTSDVCGKYETCIFLYKLYGYLIAFINKLAYVISFHKSMNIICIVS